MMENHGVDLRFLIHSFRETLLTDKMQLQQAVSKLITSSPNLSLHSKNLSGVDSGKKLRSDTITPRMRNGLEMNSISDVFKKGADHALQYIQHTTLVPIHKLCKSVQKEHWVNENTSNIENKTPCKLSRYHTDDPQQTEVSGLYLMLGANRPPPVGHYNLQGLHQDRERIAPPKYGLPGLGEYEEKRRKYQEEWRKEYSKFLRENANQPRGRRNHSYDRALNYEEVLARKREEELSYRRYNGDPVFSNEGLRPARSDGYLNRVSMPGGYSSNVDVHSEVEEVSDALERIQHYKNQLLLRENIDNEPYNNGTYTRPHSYPAETNSSGIYLPSSSYHNDYPLDQPVVKNEDFNNQMSQFSNYPVRYDEHGPSQNEAFLTLDYPRAAKNPNEAKTVSYQDELAQQMEEIRRRKQQEKEDQLRYDRKLEEENRNYNPWGRGGGGAPLRDSDGKVIASRNQLLNGNARNKTLSHALPDANPRSLSNKNVLPTYAIPRSPRHGRIRESQDWNLHEDYKKELEKQIDEKKKREREEKERERLEDEKLMHRIQQENEKTQRDYDEEMKKQKQRDEERRHRNEELQKRLEEQRKETERLKKEESEKRRREQWEARQRSLGRGSKHLNSDRKSPPLPSLKTKQNLATDKPAVTKHAESKQYNEVKNGHITGRTTKDHLLSQLSVMRQQLEKEQQIMQQQLQTQMKTSYEIYDKNSNGRKSSDKPKSDLSTRYEDNNPRNSSPTTLPSVPVSNPTKGVEGYEIPSLQMQSHSERFELNNLNSTQEESEYQYDDQLAAQRAAKQRYLSTLKDNLDEIKEDTFLDEFLAKNLTR